MREDYQTYVAQAAARHSETRAVAFTVLVHPMAALPPWFPLGNYIAAQFLSRLIIADLRRENVLAGTPVGVAGELNNCVGIFEVTDWKKAVAAISAFLKEHRLQVFAEIGVWDDQEGYWRRVLPTESARRSEFWSRNPQELIARLQAEYLESAAQARMTLQAHSTELRNTGNMDGNAS